MKNRAPKLIASAFLVVTLATACGGGGRPSVDEVSEGMQDNASEIFGDSVPTDGIDWDCMAKLYVDSDLSDDALQAIADGDSDFKGDEDDTKAAAEASKGATDCVEVPSS
ncbi:MULTISPECIES: hypothetical protein [Nocardioides]|uniref:Host cell surface-exposed lipoprotein n=1 Tax=Nocardioides lianchengensis TaxID=1045774 RepID=A0A1G7C482_9ACTN|nr:hypothetical protein [Nocardioides lianchengensis]NYG09357.1 hypothetical protein [Nocardioides lianchengensis]SDE34107.1 hypothetical protein SAMN05421872_1219 [Nocardioides lianchengensis]